MCDPLSAIAAVGSIASAGASYMSQQAAINAQNNANDQWVSYQRQQAAEAGKRDEEMRKKAEASRLSTVEKLDPNAQETSRVQEQGRLEDAMLGGGNAAGSNPNIALLSGQGTGDSTTTKDIQGRVTDAAREARKRIQALAAMSSYGNSFGGMQTNANTALLNSGLDIGLQSNLRNGNTQTLKVAQAVPVEKFQAGPDIFGGLASGLANIAGSAAGSKFSGNAF